MTKTIKMHVEFDVKVVLTAKDLEVLQKDREMITLKVIPQLECLKQIGEINAEQAAGLAFFKSLQGMDTEAYATACLKQGIRKDFAQGFNSDGTFKVSPLKFTNTTTHKE